MYSRSFACGPQRRPAQFASPPAMSLISSVVSRASRSTVTCSYTPLTPVRVIDRRLSVKLCRMSCAQAPAANVEADGGPAFGVDPTSGGGATTTARARTGDGPLPAPQPDNGTAATRGAEALGSGNGMMTSQQYGVPLPRSDGDTPTLMNADWNWDEDKLDAQLFSFLLDTPQSG